VEGYEKGKREGKRKRMGEGKTGGGSVRFSISFLEKVSSYCLCVKRGVEERKVRMTLRGKEGFFKRGKRISHAANLKRATISYIERSAEQGQTCGATPKGTSEIKETTEQI